MNATALYKNGKLEVWSGTQDGLGARAQCAKTAKLDMANVTYHLMPMGGGFGRRLPGYFNFLDYAVQTAMAMPGTPVKLLFTREEDMQHDYYRPNVMSRFRAALDAKGMPVAWTNDYTTDGGADEQAHIDYGIPNQDVRYAKVPTHVPTGPWRSVEASWHGFFIESFVDELAHAANMDPVAYRLQLLDEKPRHAEVIRQAAARAGWGTPMPNGKARGIAMFESFETIVAHVVEIEVAPDGTLKVDRVVSAVDCGSAVNPDGLKAQIEGGIIYGLSAALFARSRSTKAPSCSRASPTTMSCASRNARKSKFTSSKAVRRWAGQASPARRPLRRPWPTRSLPRQVSAFANCRSRTCR
jgi:isoquinoline 1-oxidoreductase beta subunit